MNLLGAHMSIAGGVHRAVERGASIGCQAVQIFLKNNMQWDARLLRAAEVAAFVESQQGSGIKRVFAHSSYLINLAATNPMFLGRSILATIDEIERAGSLGLPFIVMHPGSHMGAGEEAGLRQVANSLNQIFRATSRWKVRIALETTAGQGTNLGYCFDHLAHIYQSVKRRDRLAVCIDTCHLFAAGYDIRTPNGYRTTIKQLERLVGLDQVVAFHLNDSKTPLSSRVDRHAHIGQGQIGLDAFRLVLRDKRWRDVPMVLETPKSDDLHEDIENLKMLRELSRKTGIERGGGGRGKGKRL